jgi:hypothetical protein
LPGQEGKPCSGPHTRSPGRKWRDSGGSEAEFGPSSSSDKVNTGCNTGLENNVYFTKGMRKKIGKKKERGEYGKVKKGIENLRGNTT